MKRKLENMDTHAPAKRPKCFHLVIDNEVSSGCLGVSLVKKTTFLASICTKNCKLYLLALQIVRRIMQHFSNKELLKLSLINKQWNYEARSLLRNRGNIMAKIGSWSYSSCERLAAFSSDLLKMPVVPFSGISVQMSHLGKCQWTPKGVLEHSYKQIWHRQQWKRLSLNLPAAFNKCQDCPILVLVKIILENLSSVLEELALNIYLQLEFFGEYLQGRHFPRLKILKLEQVMNDSDISQNFIKALVHCAPNLKEVHINGVINVKKNILEGSSSVLVIASTFNPLYNQVCESIIGALRLKRFEVCFWRNSFDTELFNRFIPMLLQASHATLTILRMDLLFAVPLMCYGICLENVTELQIFMDTECLEDLEEPILALLKGFDFTRVFPKLTAVQIFNEPDLAFSQQQINGFVERGNAVLMNNLPDRAINIKHLTTTTAFESNGDFPVVFLAEMFPALTTLSLQARDTSEFSFRVLWENFENLEELNVKLYHRWDPLMIQNFDFDICGIFPQEVDELRDRDEEYLRCVNIVPVMPSITCLKGLKSFKISLRQTHLYNKDNVYRESLNDSTCLISKVTALVALRRCPGLTVTVQMDDRLLGPALSHLKPYASIVIGYDW